MPDERHKSPAFQFYPKDFLSDAHQTAMTLPEVGAYIRLLAHCWQEGSLPADMARLGRLCGASEARMTQLWPALEVCFRPGEEGRLIHPRLDKERVKQADFRERASAGGSAKARQAAIKQPVSSLQAPAKVLLNPALLSPISDLHLQTPVLEIALPVDLDEKWLKFQARYPGAGRQGGRMALHFFTDGCRVVGYDVIMAGLERYRLSKSVRDGFVIGMEKWLEKTMWIQMPETPAETQAEGLKAMELALAQIDAQKGSRGR